MSARRAQNKGHGFKKGASSSNPDRIATKAGMRDRSTINRLRMYKHSGPIRNRDGKIVGGDFMMKDRTGNKKVTGATGRVAPNRRWFGNTRVIGQAELDQFREAMTEAVHDPYVASLRALGSHCPGSHHANPSHRVGAVGAWFHCGTDTPSCFTSASSRWGCSPSPSRRSV